MKSTETKWKEAFGHSASIGEDPIDCVGKFTRLPTQVPNVDFTADYPSSCNGLVNFRDASTGGPFTWSWDFGDGTGSTQQNPQHQYNSNGVYNVKLIATNLIGQDSIIIGLESRVFTN